MFESKEIITGISVGLVIAALIVGALYIPRYFSAPSLPPKQKAKFISVNEQSFRDWAFRLTEKSVDYQHSGGFRSQIATFPVAFKDVNIADTEEGTRRVFGQFESFGVENYEFFGKFEAILSKIKPTEIKIQLFSGKTSGKYSSSNRISGEITIIEGREAATINGNLQIGSLNYGGLPFGGTNLKFEGDAQGITAQVSTQVSGHQGTNVELTGSFIKGTLYNLVGTVDVQSIPDLASTIQTVASGKADSLPDFMEKIPKLKVGFRQDLKKKASPSMMTFQLGTDVFGKGFSGLATLNKAEQSLKIGARMHNFWLNSFPYGLEKVSGETTTQGVIELYFNQQDDEVYGPFSTKLSGLTLQHHNFRIENANAVVKYNSLQPLEIEDFTLYSKSMALDEPFENVAFIMQNGENGLEVRDIEGGWKGARINLELNFNEGSQLPDLYVKKDVPNILELSDILGLNLKFSGPIEFRKSWSFNGEEYESKDLSFRNTGPGILTLNENIPELRNLYIKDIELILEDEQTAALNASGTNPLLYGDKPVLIRTKLQRSVAE